MAKIVCELPGCDKLVKKAGYLFAKDAEQHIPSKRQESVDPRDLFDSNSKYYQSLGGNPFSAETPITMLAKEWSNKLTALTSGSFDPLA